MSKICILDYGIGNIFSLKNILKKNEINFTYSRKKKDILNATHLILPGVGSFDVAIKKLSESIPINFLNNEVLKKKKPILGICVGMQIMAKNGYENGLTSGLGWIEGSVKIIDSKKLPLPQVGWNNLLHSRKKSDIIAGIEKKDFYFLNSYYFDVMNKNNVIAYSSYGIKFPSVIQKNNIVGVQFHPEKSQKAGLQLIKNFIKL
jgi:glutamine amidotransferase